MPADRVPPMTSRQVRNAHKKVSAQFQFTASQMKRADRREALEQRRQKEEEREQKRKNNKRKREEHEGKERAVKKRLLEEGRISLEETWGKVTASQPRLSAFFRKPALPSHIVEQNLAIHQEYLQEEEETHDSGSVIHEDARCEMTLSTTDLQPESDELSVTTEIAEQSIKAENESEHQFRGQGDNITASTLPQNLSQDQNLNDIRTDTTNQSYDEDLGLPQGFWDFLIAEDETADPKEEGNLNVDDPFKENCQLSAVQHSQDSTSTLKKVVCDSLFSSPQKSSRSVLSEMSPSKVNIRAQEKPDTSSTPKDKQYLPSPQKSVVESLAYIDEELACIQTQDLDFDRDKFREDKENEDPWNPNSAKIDSSKLNESIGTATPHKKARTPIGFGEFSDCEDLFDFDDDDDEEYDDGLDDEILTKLAFTQKSNQDFVVDQLGSPRKPAPKHNAEGSLNDWNHDMPQSLLNNRSGAQISIKNEPRANSNMTFSFEYDGADDADFVALADQVKTTYGRKSEAPAKKRRSLPWVVQPLPPPSTHELMIALTDQLDEEQ